MTALSCLFRDLRQARASIQTTELFPSLTMPPVDWSTSYVFQATNRSSGKATTCHSFLDPASMALAIAYSTICFCGMIYKRTLLRNISLVRAGLCMEPRGQICPNSRWVEKHWGFFAYLLGT